MKQRDVLDFIDKNNLGLVPGCMCSYIYNNSTRLFAGRNRFEIERERAFDATFSYIYTRSIVILFIL